MSIVDKRQARYRRILLKLSGEALTGEESFGIEWWGEEQISVGKDATHAV